MSVESAKAYIERVKTDEEFAKKVMECKAVESRMACIRAAGYDFTHDEFKTMSSELTDNELNAVVGGGEIYMNYGDPFCLPDQSPTAIPFNRASIGIGF